MSSLPKPCCAPEQYLERERRAGHKSGHLSGEIFAIAGASPLHERSGKPGEGLSDQTTLLDFSLGRRRGEDGMLRNARA